MPIDRILSRPEQLFLGIDQTNGIGLEIGALDHPCALRSVGKVYYADYCSTVQLRLNHVNTASVNLENIVDVDFITNGGPLAAIIPAELKFDYVIASHVIEHVPDIVSWLQDIGRILKYGGVLSLIVPNKNKTFDVKRSVSEQKDFFAAYLLKQRKPSPLQVFDSYRWHARNGANVHTLAYTIEMAQKALTDYVDCHCWVFTPETFLVEMTNLSVEGFIPFKIDVVTKTIDSEIDFFARLIRL